MNMKLTIKKRTIPAVIILIFLLVGISVSAVLIHNEKEQTFDIPSGARYMIAYSTGAEQKEKAVVNYFDSSGDSIGRDKFRQVICENSILYDPGIRSYMLFTNDKIYFDHGIREPLTNSEMKTKYRFATDGGIDTVYAGGYMEQWGMFYKQIKHGFTYKEKEPGHFDLLVLFDGEEIYDLRIEEFGTIAENQDEGVLYNFYGESGTKLPYETVKYDKKSKKWICLKDQLDLGAFMKENMDGDDDTYTIGKTVVTGDRIYQILELGEKGRSYLLEYKLDGNKMVYEYSKELGLKDGDSLVSDTTAAIKDGKIVYYSELEPNAVIDFDIKKKTIGYHPVFNELSFEEKEQLSIKEINGKLYLLKPDIDRMTFEIYRISGNGSLKKLVAGDLPEINKLFPSYMWIADFHVF